MIILKWLCLFVDLLCTFILQLCKLMSSHYIMVWSIRVEPKCYHWKECVRTSLYTYLNHSPPPPLPKLPSILSSHQFSTLCWLCILSPFDQHFHLSDPCNEASIQTNMNSKQLACSCVAIISQISNYCISTSHLKKKNCLGWKLILSKCHSTVHSLSITMVLFCWYFRHLNTMLCCTRVLISP